jgi:hypothetical protein
MELTSRHRGRLVLLSFVAVVATVSVTMALVSRSNDDANGRRAAIVPAPNPSPGDEVTVEQVEKMISDAGGPLLPREGEFSTASASRAWVDDFGAFGFQFPSGLIVIMQADTRTQTEAEQSIRGQIEADTAEFGASPFFADEIRDTIALAHEAGTDGPASLQWLEGTLWVEVIGYGGEDLDRVRDLVSSMRATAPSQSVA